MPTEERDDLTEEKLEWREECETLRDKCVDLEEGLRELKDAILSQEEGEPTYRQAEGNAALAMRCLYVAQITLATAAYHVCEGFLPEYPALGVGAQCQCGDVGPASTGD